MKKEIFRRALIIFVSAAVFAIAGFFVFINFGGEAQRVGNRLRLFLLPYIWFAGL